MTTEDHKARAIQKLSLELNKDINRAVQSATKCGICEMLYLVYRLHFCRLVAHLPEKRQMLGDSDMLALQMTEEGIRYSISLVAKYGKWKNAKIKDLNISRLNFRLINELMRLSNHINSKYEHYQVLGLAEVRVFGERDQHAEVNMSSVLENPELNGLFMYFARIQQGTFLSKGKSLEVNNFLEKFRDTYSTAEDVFADETGLSLNEFASNVEKLINLVTARMQSIEELLSRMPDGKYDVATKKSVALISRQFFLPRAEVKKTVSQGFLQYMDEHCFDATEFNEHELRYHRVSRRPYISGKDFFVISPQLLLDSLFVNTHYSFIESESSKQAYLAKDAARFVDKIGHIAEENGYEVIEKDLYLKKGKINLGDIDIVLKANDDHYLLVEAKNHSLPLDVYFADKEKTLAHLKRLRAEWESKVRTRLEYLKVHHGEYKIPANFDYIVVSRQPEVISHFSDILFMSIDEFEVWVSKSNRQKAFKDFYDSVLEGEFNVDPNIMRMNGFVSPEIVEPSAS